MKQVIVEITPQGETRIEAVGFKGGSCEQATKAIQEALGATVKDIKKPEYFQKNETTAQN